MLIEKKSHSGRNEHSGEGNMGQEAHMSLTFISRGDLTRVSVENFEVGFSLPTLVWPHPGKMSLPLFTRSDNAGGRDSKEK